MIYTVAAGPLRPLGYKEGIVTLMVHFINQKVFMVGELLDT
ncbi:hypothetical protein EC991805_1397 [Escherichia coli 99.1805]|nr:hypothetical protein EC991805_1397 [Escherichia coli 99.1805]